MGAIAQFNSVEDFLYHEAELLDDWNLDEWLDLFTEDAQYLVPTPNIPADASPRDTLFYIADDKARLAARVLRLSRHSAHAEFPHSQTRHLLSNIRVRENDGGELSTSAAFVTYRYKDGAARTYTGRVRHKLVSTPSGLRIREKRCDLDGEMLSPQGTISLIL